MISWTSSEFMAEVLEICKDRTYPEAAKELSTKLDGYVDPEQLRGAVRRHLQRSSRERVRAIAQPQRAFEQVSPVSKENPVRQITFGAIADSHLCSNFERLDVLESLYNIFQERGVKQVYHAGNYIDGESTFNQHEIHVHGIDGQSQYFVQNYPSREGIVTLYLDGDDHEGWSRQKHGIEMGQHIEDLARRSGRNDLTYLGYMEADVPIAEDSSRIIRVIHPGGGSSYALTYTSQKIIDSYEDYEKPDVLLIGHYHKATYLPNYRGVAIWSLGCQQEPTPFMRKKRLHADLGGWIITIGLSSNDKIVQTSSEFLTYSARPWKHRPE